MFGFFLAAAAFSICGRYTYNPHTISGPHSLPILIVGLALTALSLRRRHAVLCLLGLWCVAGSLWIAFHDTQFAAYRGAIPIHLLLACVLLVGAAFRDKIGRAIQTFGAAVLLGFALFVVFCPPQRLGNPPQAAVALYPLLMAIIAVVYGLAVKNPWYYAAMLGSLLGWAAAPGWKLFSRAQGSLPGLHYIAWGAAFFLLALLVSLIKMGALQRFFAARLKTENRPSEETPPENPP